MRYSVIFRPESASSISIEKYVATIHEGKVILRLSSNTKFYIEPESEGGVLIGKYTPLYSVRELPVMLIPETHSLFNCYLINYDILRLKKEIDINSLEFQLLKLYNKALLRGKKK